MFIIYNQNNTKVKSRVKKYQTSFLNKKFCKQQ